MRQLTISTNFCRQQVRRWQVLTGAMVFSLIISVVMTVILVHQGFSALALEKKLRQSSAGLSVEVSALEGATVHGSDDVTLRSWLSETVPNLAFPDAPSPAAVLFELEKVVPGDVFLETFVYSTDGGVELTAMSANRNRINDLLNQLQTSRVFKRTQVINQRESTPGQFEVKVKLDI